MMPGFFDTKSFGAICTGLIALGVCYVADVSDWALLALPMSATAAYWLIHRR